MVLLKEMYLKSFTQAKKTQIATADLNIVDVVVTASNSRSSLTRGGAETTVTLASVMSYLVLERKLRNLRLENDDDDEGAGDVLLFTRAGRALK